MSQLQESISPNKALTPENKLFIEQKLYKRSTVYYNQLLQNNSERQQMLRHRHNEIVTRKQNLLLLKGEMAHLKIDEIKQKYQDAVDENRRLQHALKDIKKSVFFYNDLYHQFESKVRDMNQSNEQLKQTFIDHSNTVQQLQIVQEKANNRFMQISKKENEFVQLLASLQNREKQCAKNEKKYEKILTDPIDNLELTEFIVKNVEESVIELENRDTYIDDEELIQTINSEMLALEQIYKKNKERQKVLKVKKGSLKYQNQTQSFTNSSILKSPKKRVIQNGFDEVAHQKAQQEVVNIVQPLFEQSSKLQNQSHQIDRLEMEYSKKRSKSENEYQGKIAKIKSLSKLLDEISQINSSIQMETTEISLLQRQLKNVYFNKERAIRSNSNASQSKKLLVSRNNDLKKLKSLLLLKKQQLDENALKLQKRKSQYQTNKQAISLKNIELNDFESRVKQIEEKATQLEKQIQDNCDEINETFSIIDEKSKSGFESMILDFQSTKDSFC